MSPYRCVSEALLDCPEVWQSPRELRADLRIDLMRSVVADMYKVDGDWSFVTAARAWLMPAQFSNTDRSGRSVGEPCPKTGHMVNAPHHTRGPSS